MVCIAVTQQSSDLLRHHYPGRGILGSNRGVASPALTTPPSRAHLFTRFPSSDPHQFSFFFPLHFAPSPPDYSSDGGGKRMRATHRSTRTLFFNLPSPLFPPALQSLFTPPLVCSCCTLEDTLCFCFVFLSSHPHVAQPCFLSTAFSVSPGFLKDDGRSRRKLLPACATFRVSESPTLGSIIKHKEGSRRVKLLVVKIS